ncbi:ATP-binding protein [Sphingomonas oligophenolica]|uniref:histidine kinase n=1 Tax=Sphingomonas oligophenolica TaxID=301154 RepID=A0ABU9Y3H5_9SPHN
MKFSRPRSLIARILLAEGVTILVVALALPVLLIAVLHRTAARYEQGILIDQAQAIAAALHRAGPHTVQVRLTGALQPIYATGYDGRAFIIVDNAGTILATSLNGRAIPWHDAQRGTIPSQFRSGHFVGVSLPVFTAFGTLWIIVSQDESGPGAIIDDVSRSFLWEYLGILLPILLLLPIINSLAIRRLVLEVRAVSRSAADISTTRLHMRLDESRIPDEILPLVHATNRLLDRLEAGFRQQGEFVSNVAHELRTPLAALRVRLDSVEDAAVRLALDRQVERLSHVVSQVRDLASLERFTADQREAVDLGALAREIIADMVPTILGEQHAIELRGGDSRVTVAGSRTLIGLALTNLIDNAVRHTPAGTTITVTLLPRGFSVEDDGPGVTTRDEHQVRKRFWRADRARSDSAGLGLSIVQRIVDVHEGFFSMSSRPGGGAIFSLGFPPASGAT